MSLLWQTGVFLSHGFQQLLHLPARWRVHLHARLRPLPGRPGQAGLGVVDVLVLGEKVLSARDCLRAVHPMEEDAAALGDALNQHRKGRTWPWRPLQGHHNLVSGEKHVNK